MCPGGEGAVLKTVGLKGLAGSNPVHGAKYLGGIYEREKHIIGLNHYQKQNASSV